MIVQQMNFSNKPTGEISQKFVIGFLAVLTIGIVVIYLVIIYLIINYLIMLFT